MSSSARLFNMGILRAGEDTRPYRRFKMFHMKHTPFCMRRKGCER